MTKDGLHAVELGILVDLYHSLGHGVLLAELGVEFGVEACPINVLFLRCLPN